MDLKGNLSTEHQRPGDAKRPDDTQDRPQTSGDGDLAESPEVNDGEEDQIHQAVDNQSSVRPEDYPDNERAR